MQHHIDAQIAPSPSGRSALLLYQCHTFLDERLKKMNMTRPLPTQPGALQKWLLPLLAAGVLAGCATTSAPPPNLEAEAMKQSEKFWGHAAQAQHDKAYEMLTRSSKETVTPQRLAGQLNNLRVQKAVAKSAECKDGTCSVSLDLDVVVRIPNVGIRTYAIPHTDVWLYEGGELKLVRK